MDIYETIINDFVDSADTHSGYGLFSGIEPACELARILSKNAIRSFKRYKIVPQLFFQCLRQAELIDPKTEIPRHGLNLHETGKFLNKVGCLNGISPSEFKALNLQKQSGSQQHVWEKSQLYNVKETVWQQEQAERDARDRL